MKILIISAAFAPDNSPRSFRTTELVKELARRGHNITVYLPRSKADRTSFVKEYPNVSIKESIVPARKIPGPLSSIFYYLFCYPAIKYYCELPDILKREKNYDLLISIAAPHPIHWGVARAFKANPQIAKTWVADCGDPFMLANQDKGSKPFYFKYFEHSWCKRANFITIPVENARGGYYPEYQDKIRIIPQAFDFSEVTRAEYIKNKVPTFAYAGRFVKRDLDPRPIMDYLLQKGGDFKFIAYTQQRSLFAEYMERMGECLELRDFVDRKTLLFELSKMDFLLYLTCSDPTRSPSKMIDYTLTGRPILSIDSCNVDNVLFDAFLNGDYSKQTITDIEDSNIINATSKFLSFVNNGTEK